MSAENKISVLSVAVPVLLPNTSADALASLGLPPSPECSGGSCFDATQGIALWGLVVSGLDLAHLTEQRSSA